MRGIFLITLGRRGDAQRKCPWGMPSNQTNIGAIQ